jgi:hypothetical protein
MRKPGSTQQQDYKSIKRCWRATERGIFSFTSTRASGPKGGGRFERGGGFYKYLVNKLLIILINTL